MKHRLKMLLRELYARLLFHTGLYRLVDRLMPRRLTILAGHCVDLPACNGFLPKDMKISRERLRQVLAWLGRRFELVNVGEGWRRLQGEGGAGSNGRSLVALSMDDGYRDNREALLPLLEELGASATVYLESRPLDERKVNWSHKYFWVLERIDHEELVERYVAVSRDEAVNAALRRVVEGRERLSYLLKKVLKYEAEQGQRDRAIDAVFAQVGGDERALCDALYLTWDDARALAAAGVELGGHTVNHYVLTTLDEAGQRREIADGRAAVAAGLGAEVPSFAYPFGREWDWNAASCAAVRAAGYTTAVTTHAGTNGAQTDPTRLHRWMIDEDVALHLVAAEACGGFELLRRLGLDLSE